MQPRLQTAAMFRSIFCGVMAFLLACSSSVDSKKKKMFSNTEIQVDLGPFEVLEKPQRKKADSYFYRVKQQIKFCKQPELPPYVQQVHSESGWLCELYVLGVADEKTVRADIKRSYPENKFGHYSKVQKLKIAGFDVLKWRYRIGKTRLDHFLVFAKQFHYLFVSSPYGDGARIHKIVETMKYN